MIQSQGRAPSGVYAGIFLCSLAVLMQEVLLTRIFSFTIWYHLAYLTISTALLGFGAAGSLLSAFPGLLADPRRLAARCAAGAAVALLAGMAVLGQWPLSPDRLLTEPGAFFVGLLGYYAIVLAPFLLAGLAVAAPLAAYPAEVNRLYAADLFGAGLGCAAAVAALTFVDGPAALALCAATFAGAGALYAISTRTALAFAALAAALVVASPAADRVLKLVPTSTKAMGAALREAGTRMLFTQWSPVNRVDVYQLAQSQNSFWSSVGRGTGFSGKVPPTLEIQYDAHNGTNVYPLLRSDGSDALELLDTHLLRTPYLLYDKPRVLVIGVGGGIDVMNALRRGASHVTGVDLQPITISLHAGPLAKWTGGAFQRPEVELVAAEGRHYVRSHHAQYDLIQISAVDTFSAQTTGAYVLAESYLYTVEAFQDYLEHLAPDGVLSVVLGDVEYRDPTLVPPLVTRLLLIAREALERTGAADPTAHLVVVGQRIPSRSASPDQVISGATVGGLLVKKAPFTSAELDRIRGFATANGFRIRLAPDDPGDAPITRIVRAPRTELPALLAAQPFTVEPVTDERPFFYHVLPWGALLSAAGTLWFFPGSSTGQIMLLMMLGQAVLFGAALILLPLLRGAGGALRGRTTAGFLLYFLGLGLGFLLIEISFVQKYVLLLGYPTYSLSVTIFSLLVFAALGAALSRRGWRRPRRFLARLLAVTVAIVVLEVVTVPALRERFLAASLPVRIALTVLLQLPIGVALGMYFPTGIELLRRLEPRLVPWAWGINGVASVASSVLAVILGMAIGFSGVALVAAGIYVVGTLSLLAVLPRDADARSS